MNTLAFLVVAAAPAFAQVRAVPSATASVLPGVRALTEASIPAGGLTSAQTPVSSALIQLIIEPIPMSSPDSRWMSPEHEDAVTAALAAVPSARELKSRGGSPLSSSRIFVEVDRAAAPELSRRLEAAGLRAASLDEVVALMNRRGAAPATDEELSAAAALFENGDVRQRAEAFGRVAAAVEEGKSSGVRFSPQARRSAADALYSGAATMVGLFNAIRGEQKTAILKALDHNPWTEATERAVDARLDVPELKSQVEPIRTLTARAALALQDLRSEHWVSYVNALLPHAEYAAAEAIASSPARATSFVSSWIAHLRSSVAAAVKLANTTDRLPQTRVGGVGNHVLGGRKSVSYDYKTSRRPFGAGDEHHYAWALLGMSDAVAASWTARFIDLLRAADAAIAPVEAADHLAEMERASAQLAGMAGDRINDPSLSEAKINYMDRAEKFYQENSRIEGFIAVDRALSFLSFGPWSGRSRARDDGRYVTTVAGVLATALESVRGAATLKVVIDAALGFAEAAVRWDADLPAAAREAAENLGRAAHAAAARLGLELTGV